MFVLNHRNPFSGFNRWVSNTYANYIDNSVSRKRNNKIGYDEPDHANVSANENANGINAVIQAGFGFFNQNRDRFLMRREHHRARGLLIDSNLSWMRWSY